MITLYGKDLTDKKNVDYLITRLETNHDVLKNAFPSVAKDCLAAALTLRKFSLEYKKQMTGDGQQSNSGALVMTKKEFERCADVMNNHTS